MVPHREAGDERSPPLVTRLGTTTRVRRTGEEVEGCRETGVNDVSRHQACSGGRNRTSIPGSSARVLPLDDPDHEPGSTPAQRLCWVSGRSGRMASIPRRDRSPRSTPPRRPREPRHARCAGRARRRGDRLADDGADGPRLEEPVDGRSDLGAADDARLQIVEHRVAEARRRRSRAWRSARRGRGRRRIRVPTMRMPRRRSRGKERFQHPPRRCCVHGYEPVPRPLASTGSPASMAGTSEPSPRPTAAMWFRVAVGCHSSPRASSVAAASALPPASPAATGTRLSREIATDGGTPRREASAGPLARRGSARRAFLRGRRGRRSPRGSARPRRLGP